MGGYGSGRRGYSRKLEDWLTVDIRELRKGGHLRRPGASVTCGLYSASGNLLASVRLIITPGRVWFTWQTRAPSSSESWRDERRTVDIDHAPCNFGGTRSWFICPQCSRRIAAVYVDGSELGCRHCLDLAYESQSETLADRARRRERKIRRKLGMGANLVVPLGDKPKWMHWQTYVSLCAAATRHARISVADLRARTPTSYG